MTDYTPDTQTLEDLQAEAKSEFPWADFSKTFSIRENADALIEWADKNFIYPEDIEVWVGRNRTFDKPAWNVGYPYPDTFTVYWRSKATQAARADAEIDKDYPVFRRMTG